MDKSQKHTTYEAYKDRNIKKQKHIDLVKLLVDRDILCNQSHLVVAMIERSFEEKEPIINFYDNVINFNVITNEEAIECGYESLEAMEDSDGTDKEVFEWWLVSDWLAGKLEEIGGVILKSDYGTWWGREECGQSLTMDSNINAVAAKE